MAEPTRESVIGASVGPRQLFEGKAAAPVKPDLIKRVDDLEKTLTEKKSLEQLKALATGSIDKRKAETARDKIGTLKDDGTRDRTTNPDHTRKHTEASAAITKLNDYLDTGYDKLNATQKTEFRKIMAGELAASPLMADIVGEMKNKTNKAVMETYLDSRLQDDTFRNLVVERFNAATEKGLALKDDELMQATDDRDVKKQDRDDKNEQFIRAEKARKANEQILNDNYVNGDPKAGVKAGSALEGFNKTIATDTPDYDTKIFKQEVAEVKMNAASLAYSTNKDKTKTAALYADFEASKLDYLAATDDVERSRGAQRKKLEKDLATAQNNRQALEDGEKKAKVAAETADKILTRAEARLTQVQTERDNAEQDYVDALNNVIKDATQDWLEAKTSEITELYDKQLADNQAKTEADAKKDGETKKTRFEGLLHHDLESRWSEQRRGGLLNRERYHHRTHEIQSDFDTLMRDGPETLTIQIARQRAIDSGIFPGPPAAPPTYEQFTDGMSKIGVDVKALQGDLAGQVLHRKIATGGLRRDEAAQIVGTKWGEAAIAEGLRKNKAFREAMASLDEQDGNQQGIFGRTMNVLKDKPWLLAILLSPFVLMGTSLKDVTEMQ